jgi:uncharacterized protein YndB with AHSA1/START domain
MATSISTIKINASMDRVWETITKAELVKLWQYGSDLITSQVVISGLGQNGKERFTSNGEKF